MFSKWTLSISFRMAFSLNKGLVWQFFGLKLIILRDFLKDYKAFDRASFVSKQEKSNLNKIQK